MHSQQSSYQLPSSMYYGSSNRQQTSKYIPPNPHKLPLSQSESVCSAFMKRNHACKDAFNFEDSDDEQDEYVRQLLERADASNQHYSQEDEQAEEYPPAQSNVRRRKKTEAELINQKQKKVHRQPIDAEILAARNCRNWKDFCDTGKKWGGIEDKSKRIRRYLMMANAMEALEDIPIQQDGHKFMGNTWGMGPFYAWDHNFNQQAKTKKATQSNTNDRRSWA